MRRKRLPKGLWWDADQKCYRVRLYRNNVPFYGGKYQDFAEALFHWKRLRKQLNQIPLLRPGERHTKELTNGTIQDLLTGFAIPFVFDN